MGTHPTTIGQQTNLSYVERTQNAEYEVIDDSQEHWWKVKDQHGTVGYIPSNYVKAKELLGLDKYEYVTILVGLFMVVCVY